MGSGSRARPVQQSLDRVRKVLVAGQNGLADSGDLCGVHPGQPPLKFFRCHGLQGSAQTAQTLFGAGKRRGGARLVQHIQQLGGT